MRKWSKFRFPTRSSLNQSTGVRFQIEDTGLTKERYGVITDSLERVTKLTRGRDGGTGRCLCKCLLHQISNIRLFFYTFYYVFRVFFLPRQERVLHLDPHQGSCYEEIGFTNPAFVANIEVHQTMNGVAIAL